MATAMGGGEPKMLAMPMAILGKAVIQNTTGWWLSPTPLKNDGVRQLLRWLSHILWKIKNV